MQSCISMMAFFGVGSRKECYKHMKVIVSDVEQSGFVINTAKSQLEPHQLSEYLGFTVDLGCFKVPYD